MFPVFKGDFYRFRMKDLKLFSLKNVQRGLTKEARYNTVPNHLLDH